MKKEKLESTNNRGLSCLHNKAQLQGQKNLVATVRCLMMFGEFRLKITVEVEFWNPKQLLIYGTKLKNEGWYEETKL